MKATLERSPLNIYTHTPIPNYTKSITSKLYIFLHKNNKIQNIFVYIQHTQTNKIRNIYKSTKIYKQPNLNNPRKIKKKFQNKKIKKIVGEQPAVKWCANRGGRSCYSFTRFMPCACNAYFCLLCAHTKRLSCVVWYMCTPVTKQGLKTLICMQNGRHTHKWDYSAQT